MWLRVRNEVSPSRAPTSGIRRWTCSPSSGPDPPYGETNFQSFWVVLGKDFPVSRNEMLRKLMSHSISARRGFMAAHLEPAYSTIAHGDLAVTEHLTLARRALDAACRMYDSGRPDLTEIAGLEKLAFKTYRRAREVNEWKSLRRRQRIGPIACLALRPFMLLTVASQSWRKVKRYRIHRMGLL